MTQIFSLLQTSHGPTVCMNKTDDDFLLLPTHPASSRPQRSPRCRRSVRPHSGPCRCSCWGSAGRCSPRRWSAGSTRSGRPRIGPCRGSRWDTWAGYSRGPCSPGGTRTSRPRSGRCRCSRQGRWRWSSRGPASRGRTRSCRRWAGRCRGRHSWCPHLRRGGGRRMWRYVTQGAMLWDRTNRPTEAGTSWLGTFNTIQHGVTSL